MNTNENNKKNTDTGEQLLLPFDPPLEEATEANVPKSAEIDALRVENDELRTVIRLRDARDRITALLKTAGARSPDLMFDAAKESLQFGDDGELQNSEAIVVELKRKFPEQFGGDRAPVPPIDGGAGTGSATNVLTKEALAEMKPADIARLDWDEVRQVLSN